MVSYSKVILIGGSPLTGKTSLAAELASELGYDHVSTDDIGEAARATVEERSRPEFHPMKGRDYREYYLSRSVDDLMHDALALRSLRQS